MRSKEQKKKAESYPRFTDMNAVRGVEANAARLYWPALASLIRQGMVEADFKRKRIPAASAFNAVLNFTSHLLKRDMETLVLGKGLHPGFGVLHSVYGSRVSCVFDLMEEFRAPVPEALAVNLLSTRTLSAKHFDEFTVSGKTVQCALSMAVVQFSSAVMRPLLTIRCKTRPPERKPTGVE